MWAAMSTALAATLRVRDQGRGPVISVRFRLAGAQPDVALGRGWLVREGDADAKPRGRAIGAWVDRRGRPVAGALTVDAAWRAVPAAIEEYEQRLRKQAAQAVRASEEARTLGRVVEAWLVASKNDDPAGRWEAWKHSHAKNMTNYARRIAREIGPDRPIDSINADELGLWLSDGLRPRRNGKVLDRPVSRKLRATYSHTLGGLFGYAYLQGWIAQDPTSELPAYRTRRKRADDPLRRDEYLTKDELRLALAALRAGEPRAKRGRSRSAAERAQDAAMIVVMAMAGLRPGESLPLLWEHIDFGSSVIRVVESRTMGVTDTPKSGSGRTVPMSREVARVMKGLAARGFMTAPIDRVFVGRDGGFVDLVALGERFDGAQRRAGVSPRRQLRQMRNTFGTVCAADGVPLRTIQQWMGHASITTTEIYASFMPRAQDAALIEKAFS
jgi:integrase